MVKYYCGVWAVPDRLTQPLCLFEILPCSYPPWKHVALPSVFASDATMCGNPVAQDLVGLVYNLSRVPNTEKQEVANWRRAAVRDWIAPRQDMKPWANMTKHGKFEFQTRRLALEGVQWCAEASPHLELGSPRPAGLQVHPMLWSPQSSRLFFSSWSFPMPWKIVWPFDCLVVLPHLFVNQSMQMLLVFQNNTLNWHFTFRNSDQANLQWCQYKSYP